MVSRQIPGARIMACQYDFADSPANPDWKDLTDQWQRLLYALVHRREEHGQINRPIVFLCYSFGALLLKKVELIDTHAATESLKCSAGFAGSKSDQIIPTNP